MNLANALEMVALSDCGRVRDHNEDAVACDAALGLAVLADGMGGHNAGEVASGMVTSLLVANWRALGGQLAPLWATGQVAATLRQQVAEANQAVFNLAASQPRYAGMGTTLVQACFGDDRLVVAHVGDSRLYRLRGERFEALTRDDSVLQAQIDSGMLTEAQARRATNRNLVTRAVGVAATVEVTVQELAVEAGDVYLLCSDGLNDMLTDAQIGLALRTLAEQPALAAAQLIEMANDQGGRDNVSVIVVRVRQSYGVPRGRWQKLMAWLK